MTKYNPECKICIYDRIDGINRNRMCVLNKKEYPNLCFQFKLRNEIPDEPHHDTLIESWVQFAETLKKYKIKLYKDTPRMKILGDLQPEFPYYLLGNHGHYLTKNIILGDINKLINLSETMVCLLQSNTLGERKTKSVDSERANTRTLS